MALAILAQVQTKLLSLPQPSLFGLYFVRIVAQRLPLGTFHLSSHLVVKRRRSPLERK